ncbi:hypothetical protein [Kitasatospora sp. NPDC085879]|uniref:hypothetical protein n=1 Tax=Kitasatospora sp. NPDC085879 TaxID=3154769 RepID=UPI00341E5E4D
MEDTPNNGGSRGHHRELGDADPAHCPGYGDRTADGPPGRRPPCGGRAEIDMIFVREDRIAGPYGAEAIDAPADCQGLKACSDHRMLVGAVTVRP